ncbi:MAG: glycoside hydrolase family 95 protein, partial [Lachnospiraceae bacterium]|nr:glycoside hydrolase family 95 protein [Lachnospiraceae bacterium]
MSRLWYRQPAKQWEEALALGNGRLGAMVFGGTDSETIQVNEESMWFGGPVNRNNPDACEYLPKIREHLFNGQISKAEKLMTQALSGCPESMHCYQTLGDINFWFENMPLGEASEYVRSLSLDDAISQVQFKKEDTLYEREVFVSKPADCMIMKFSAKGSKKLNFSARLGRGRWFDGVKKTGKDSILLYGNLGRGGYEFAMSLKAASKDGKVNTIGETLIIEDASQVILYFTADTTYHYTTTVIDEWLERHSKEDIVNTELITDRLEGSRLTSYRYQLGLQKFLLEKIQQRFDSVTGKSYDDLRQEHIKDYRALYERTVLRLSEDDKYDDIPTDIRLKHLKENPDDNGLCRLLFDFGRYLTISCSREGGLAATLQGLWNKEFFPPWDSKYTININTEMNYWHVESTNLSECHEPLFGLIYKMVRNGRVTANRMYGCRGFVAHHNTDIHGDTAPQDVWLPGTYWTMGAAWLCTHLWQHYNYTLDLDFLVKAFPVMAEAALFFVDFLVEKDGYLVTNPSVSPENTYILPNGEHGACCVGPTMDNQILRDLFRGCKGAYDVLVANKLDKDIVIHGVSSLSELMEQIKSCNDRIMPDRISKSGRIMEWMEDYEELEPGHRHISNLYGLYPGEEITMDKTPELAAAARKTLEYRLSHGGGHTGWSRAWIMNHYASLWDGEKTYENI